MYSITTRQFACSCIRGPLTSTCYIINTTSTTCYSLYISQPSQFRLSNFLICLPHSFLLLFKHLNMSPAASYTPRVFEAGICAVILRNIGFALLLRTATNMPVNLVHAHNFIGIPPVLVRSIFPSVYVSFLLPLTIWPKYCHFLILVEMPLSYHYILLRHHVSDTHIRADKI